MFTRLLFLILIFFGAAMSPIQAEDSPTRQTASTKPSRLQPIEVTQAFWHAVKHQDFGMMEKIVAFPFAWDGRCRFLESFPALKKQLAKQRPIPPGLSFEQFSQIDPSKPTKDKRFMRGIRRLYRPQLCEEPSDAEHQKKLMTYKEAFVILYIMVQKEAVPTVTRLSLIQGHWRVTGFDN
jgi:hypothetical protein